MCGIIAILRRHSTRPVPNPDDILDVLAPLTSGFLRGDPQIGDVQAGHNRGDALDVTAELMERANTLLLGVPGATALIRNPGLAERITSLLAPVQRDLRSLETELDKASESAAPDERANAQLLRLKDARWAIIEDRLRTAAKVRDLAGANPSDAAIAGLTSVQQALSAIDRLEVRGRDSAGLHLFVHQVALGHSTLTGNEFIVSAVQSRAQDPLFRSGSVRLTEHGLSFVYKAAAEIGELGDNTAALRDAIRSDELLQAILRDHDVDVSVLGHTRWASVGIISEANAHPLNSELVGDAPGGPYSVAALNGDVDNHADLCSEANLCFASAITTDAKVIPSLLAKHGETGQLDEAFRRTVASFEGSVAIAAQSETAPDQMYLALRGSGQALYVGLAEDAFVIASEPYGLIEMTPNYLRMDGETPANADNENSSRGQIVRVDATRAGDLTGISRVGYDGTDLPVHADELVQAEITTRDIDRGGFPHFLLKEITEAPQSFRKTLRGKLRTSDGQLSVILSEATIPTEVREQLRSGAIDEVIAIAQGTAFIAADSFARALQNQLRRIEDCRLRVRSMPATELSGFGMDRSFASALVVAVSQSGTTTDTNRTVDLVRRKGARVISIVNRRGSDLTDKSDGVLYTSDGRDVEMSVASTKAFYSQVAAGFLLATAIAEEAGGDTHSPQVQSMLHGLIELPDAMDRLLTRREKIGDIAQRLAPSRRYWAIVGNGPNRVAAEEVRIKLSELCYKSMACDATEDKKHIDLSSEPLILVCAAGLEGSNADDVAKEVAIFRAHKAAPIVIANEGDQRYSNALDIIAVPPVEPELGFVLSTMAGHLFGYEAAKAIDALADPLREVHAAIEHQIDQYPSIEGAEILRHLSEPIEHNANRFYNALRNSKYNGHVEASTAARLAAVFRYAMRKTSLDSYQLEFGKVGTPGIVVEDLMAALTAVIEELTRPIDAIKHQAKTVTVGISRTDETLLQVPLVASVLAAGASRDSLTFDNLQTLSALDAAVQEVTGFTRYRIEGDPSRDDASLFVVDRGGISTSIPSRVDRDPVLKGTKHRAATGRRVGVTKGRSDGRTVILVPEIKDAQSVGLTLLHVRFRDLIDSSVARGVLLGYNIRYSALRDAVLETEPVFNDDLLGEIPMEDLLTLPLADLANHWTDPR